MLRGYRYIVLAAVGWLILAASPHPQEVAKSEQTDAIADALTNIARTYDKQVKDAESSEEKYPCVPGNDNRLSDLCAQWKATDAADTAAWWARLSGALSIVGLLGVAGALILTVKSNNIARTNAHHELRAYVFPKRISWDIRNPKSLAGYLDLAVVWENAGQTPTRHMSVIAYWNNH